MIQQFVGFEIFYKPDFCTVCIVGELAGSVARSVAVAVFISVGFIGFAATIGRFSNFSPVCIFFVFIFCWVLGSFS